MITKAPPQIGFDRFIDLKWIRASLDIRVERGSLDGINGLLDRAGLSTAAKKKVRTILNRLCLAPRTELKDFASRGVAIYRANPALDVAVLAWGMAIATYPFFGKVVEIVGRLSALQGDCAASEVHRRMSEMYGEREGTYRMTNMVLQSQANWGAIQRVENGRRIARLPRRTVGDDRAMDWLVEAAVRYLRRPVSIATLQSAPVLFPFGLSEHLAYVISKSEALELRSEGVVQQSVALRTAT